jgi:hypothetical protein
MSRLVLAQEVAGSSPARATMRSWCNRLARNSFKVVDGVRIPVGVLSSRPKGLERCVAWVPFNAQRPSRGIIGYMSGCSRAEV